MLASANCICWKTHLTWLKDWLDSLNRAVLASTEQRSQCVRNELYSVCVCVCFVQKNRIMRFVLKCLSPRRDLCLTRVAANSHLATQEENQNRRQIWPAKHCLTKKCGLSFLNWGAELLENEGLLAEPYSVLGIVGFYFCIVEFLALLRQLSLNGISF